MIFTLAPVYSLFSGRQICHVRFAHLPESPCSNKWLNLQVSAARVGTRAFSVVSLSGQQQLRRRWWPWWWHKRLQKFQFIIFAGSWTRRSAGRQGVPMADSLTHCLPLPPYPPPSLNEEQPNLGNCRGEGEASTKLSQLQSLQLHSFVPFRQAALRRLPNLVVIINFMCIIMFRINNV